MKYQLFRDVLDLLEEFEAQTDSEADVNDFVNWLSAHHRYAQNEPNWEGKVNGRSPESAINTLIVHLNRYAKSYSKSAIFDSDFSTQEDFIYLINLKAFGKMSKMELIKKNVHEKPVGMQIINRLIALEWVEQTDSETDKRSKVISITPKGLAALEGIMGKIRQATEIVTGALSHPEKMELIGLLNKLNDFHQPIYDRNIGAQYLLNEAVKFKN